MVEAGRTQIVKWTAEGAVKGSSHPAGVWREEEETEYSATFGLALSAGSMFVLCKAHEVRELRWHRG